MFTPSLSLIMIESLQKMFFFLQPKTTRQDKIDCIKAEEKVEEKIEEEN